MNQQNAIELQLAQIEDLERENAQLKKELRSAQEEIARLQGLVERYTLQARQRR